LKRSGIKRETSCNSYYLAIDIGASSGRHIVGWKEGGDLKTEEVFRFANGAVEKDGHLVWDPEKLFAGVVQGIAAAFARFPVIESLSIDTWGVDYVLMEHDREILPCYAYRDKRTESAVARVHEKVPFSELYRRTGCQFQQFNSIYQLYDDLRAGRLEKATDFLMIPEYLMYRLTGRKKKEYTNATTTGLVSAMSGGFDPEILTCLGLPRRLFGELSMPGEYVGELKEEISVRVGGQTKVVLCATHDTASAVEGIDMPDDQPYISSGTWSLLGVKTPKPLTDGRSEQTNYSNEGGVGYNRYQKNIMGMWLVQRLQKELCPGQDFETIVREAEQSSYEGVVDVDAPGFLAPVSMKETFDQALSRRPQTGDGCKEEPFEKPWKEADYFRCAYRSLARGYRAALEELERNTGRTYDKLYIVGGGAKNRFLNRLTEEATGKNVIALPIEATALGNLKKQMEGKKG